MYIYMHTYMYICKCDNDNNYVNLFVASVGLIFLPWSNFLDIDSRFHKVIFLTIEKKKTTVSVSFSAGEKNQRPEIGKWTKKWPKKSHLYSYENDGKGCTRFHLRQDIVRQILRQEKKKNNWQATQAQKSAQAQKSERCKSGCQENPTYPNTFSFPPVPDSLMFTKTKKRQKFPLEKRQQEYKKVVKPGIC